ncbi:hypothetical protein BpHYR1_026780 [Brachionus plicatilis]|uniref:Uncharacterized protein n=1 Tax=Brachionus plicatilis TaxID=10195 RepID=A0A3M7Q9R4_BRAPC|nr:hypothetical protein BpHYR1_026780 [Brachionus plicatilis]
MFSSKDRRVALIFKYLQVFLFSSLSAANPNGDFIFECSLYFRVCWFSLEYFPFSIAGLFSKLVNDVNFFEYKRPAYIQRNTLRNNGSNKKVTSNKPRPDNDHSGRSSRLVCGSNPSVPTVLHGRPNRPIRPTRPTNPADLSDQPNRPAVPT